MLYINKHNEEEAEGKHTFKLGVNKFSDLTHEEWVEGLKGGERRYKDVEYPKTSKNLDRPDSVDWRDDGYVTGVKDQGQCGSCWSFGATGAMEGAIFKKTGELVSLSEQNLVDCDHQSSACNGGLEIYAYQYVIQNGGINTEADYPYQASKHSCRFDENNRVLTIQEYKDVTPRDEEDLQNQVAVQGPLSVGIDASQRSFQSYHSGVYYEPNCHALLLDHAVLLVGYGTDSGTHGEYYMVKNSWGTSWGINGYIKMSRNRDNNCGIATDSHWPVA